MQSNSYSCDMEKKSRSKSVFSKMSANWQLRKFVITGQQMSYYDGSSLKGAVSINKCHVQVMANGNSETDNKPFPFELQIDKESMLLSCATETIRTEVVEILMLASKTADWVDPKTVKKPDLIANIDKDALMQDFHASSVQSTMKNSLNIITAHTNMTRLKNARDRGDKIAAKDAAFMMISSFILSAVNRRRANKMKAKSKNLAIKDISARKIQQFYKKFKAIQSWREPTFLHPFLMKVNVGQLNFKQSLANNPNYIVVLSGVNITNVDIDASADARLASGVCTTCDHTRLSPAPDISQNLYVGGVNSESYLAITVLLEGANRTEFVGQGSLRLSDYSRDLFVRTRPVEVSVSLGKAKVQIRKDGGSFAEIGQELHQVGEVSLTLTIPPRPYNMAGSVTRLTETLVASNFKKRYMVLCDGVLSYFGTSHSLDDVKHFIVCEDVVSISEEVYKGHECLRIRVAGQTELERGENWYIKWEKETYSPSYKSEWMRKILRSCKKLQNPDLQEVKATI